MKREPFDPSHLVALARTQHPEAPWLAEALARCTAGRWESRAYLHVVDPSDPTWQVEQTVLLHDRARGDVVVDVLTGQRVGGIEFLRHL